MAKIPTTILTGFLGAGKTTLLNHLLSGNREKIAVIVNEYGDVGIDGMLVVETQEEIVELNNGCICCTVRDDLVEALKALLASGKQIDRIMIETSGLADPAPVIQTFILDETLANRLAIDAIVTVVDAYHVEDQLLHDEAVEQISFADVLILNKIDLVSEDHLRRTMKRLRQFNPLAAILSTTSSKVDLDDIIDVGAFDLKKILAIEPDLLEEHDHEHDASIGCVAIRETAPLDPNLLNGWLNRLVQEKGKDLFRMKGVLFFQDEVRRSVFHGVHMILEGRPGKPWSPTETRKTDIVFIGRNLDADELRAGLQSCLAPPRALAS